MPVRIRGQLLIVPLREVKFKKYRIDEVGRKGFMQRRSAQLKSGDWVTAGYQFNLSHYKTLDDFVEDLMTLYKDLTNTQMGKAERLAANWWRTHKVK